MLSKKLTENEFDLLYYLYQNKYDNQRQISKDLDFSVGKTNNILSKLKEQKLIDNKYQLTNSGLKTLDQFKVDNALIMAAGMSTRFVPFSYERPKGTLVVKGEVLIERQIKQLRDAGIDNIILVLGYKKEEFFYLEDKYNVKILVNTEYAQRNNNSTIFVAQDYIKNTYICSSDNYFAKNPFKSHVYCSYYAAVYCEGPTDEYCINTKPHSKTIISAPVGGADSWIMMGHAYWDKSYSEKYIKFLNDEYSLNETKGKLWEDIYLDHVKDLKMDIKKYPDEYIYEFDSLEDLRKFDPMFINNVKSDIMDNICKVLKCKRDDIVHIFPLTEGLTNLSFKFSVKSDDYVYRHPGAGTNKIINRKCEAQNQALAKKMGIDNSFIYEDEVEGWKISKFIDNSRMLDYDNDSEVKQALQMIRKLHLSDYKTEWSFDLYENTNKIIKDLDKQDKLKFKDFKELSSIIDTIHEELISEDIPECLCHNDFYYPNILFADNEVYLIDWEYSAMSDYASDLGTFICCSDYSLEKAEEVIQIYFSGKATKDEIKHCISYVALAAFYWFVWAIFKDKTGSPVGDWLYKWYKKTKIFGSAALDLIKE